jgi:hypothetical protein
MTEDANTSSKSQDFVTFENKAEEEGVEWLSEEVDGKEELKQLQGKSILIVSEFMLEKHKIYAGQGRMPSLDQLFTGKTPEEVATEYTKNIGNVPEWMKII